MEVLAVAVAAENLEALKTYLSAVDCRKQLCLCCDKSGALAGCLLERCLIGHQLHSRDKCGHVTELKHNALVLCDGLTEGDTLICILLCDVYNDFVQFLIFMSFKLLVICQNIGNNLWLYKNIQIGIDLF